MKIFSHGILGINARNLKYIREKNDINKISLANSKLKTKNFLEGRGVPFSQTYAVIDSQNELKHFSFDSIQESSFVIKPNQGSKGRGILIVRRKKNGIYTVLGEEWSEDALRLHMTDILRGSYSLHGGYDRVIIEELLVAGKDFARYCRYGLADIRMIVYNYVPIAANIRMPTLLSGGKANLAQGGIGLGLNISTGEVMSLFMERKNYTHTFPEKYAHMKGSYIPFWDNILLYSSQVQSYTSLGYLALDWVITKNGPKLLEINARAGLEIQNVSLVPLAKRLEQVQSLKITSPEKGVEITKTLFYSGILSSAIGKNILSFEQKCMIRGEEVTLKVDPKQSYTLVSADVQKKYGTDSMCVLPDNTRVLFHAGGTYTGGEKALIILGQNDLQNVLLRPQVHIRRLSQDASGYRWGKSIHDIDTMVYNISKKLHLGGILRPMNFQQELNTFLEKREKYNPIFHYNFPPQKRLSLIREDLDVVIKAIEGLNNAKANFKALFLEKCSEIEDRLQLVKAYMKEDYAQIGAMNMKLFGEFHPTLLAHAKKKVFDVPTSSQKLKIEKSLGKILNLDEIIERIEHYCEENNIEKIPVHISDTIFSRMSISYKKEGTHINIKRNIMIHEHEMLSILEHEIGTHFRRYIAGLKTDLKLFTHGTGYYIQDEEGFAIYNSCQVLPQDYQKMGMYYKYYLISQVDTLSFAQTAALIRSLFPERTPEQIFSQAVRLKRGITHTALCKYAGTTYQKDKIYLDGYQRVTSWIQEGGDASLLYFGKIKIKDLPRIAHL